MVSSISMREQYFMTGWNKHPEFISTLSRMRGHHPRGKELHNSALHRSKIDFPAVGIRDNVTDSVKYGAMKVIKQLREGKEVFLDVNRLQECSDVVKWLDEHRDQVERENGSDIFDKLYFVAEPPPPVPVLTQDFHYARTIANMWKAQKDLEQREQRKPMKVAV